MRKILRKRVPRELRENLFRYLALGLLIILCMYVVVGLIGAADTVITGGAAAAEANHVEDGEFTVFVPLTDAQRETFAREGVTLEAQFYLDFSQEGAGTLRVFKNRKEINLVIVEQGAPAKADDEVVLEKRYCAEHGLSVGDEIEIGGKTFTIAGIGCTPDYEAPFKELSDSTVDSAGFGPAFVTEGAYDALKRGGMSAKAEEYTYAYLLNGGMEQDGLKAALKDITVDADAVDDIYFKEYWKKTGGKKEELRDGVNELYDGAMELSDGLEELKAHEDDVNGGAEEVFWAYLKEASDGLKGYGLTAELTEDNFEAELARLKASTDSAIFRLKLISIEERLKELHSYKEGVAEYTDGVGKAADGAEELFGGVEELKENTNELLEQYFDVELSNLTRFLPAEDNPRIGAAGNDQIINKVGGLIAGAIIMILFTYVISVFVVHGIERESGVIGVLYALGVRRSDLLRHYLTLPVIVTAVSGVIGTAIGLSPAGVRVQMEDCYSYFSFPEVDVVCRPYLLVYGLVMPTAAAVFVNWLVIRKKLARPVLSMIRGEAKSSRFGTVQLGNMDFVGRFCIRQMLREFRCGCTVVFGMFISLLIAMLGINCYMLCSHIREETKADTKYEYMYTFKYPTEEAPEGGTACYAVGLKSETLGYNLDVTLLGIGTDNPYFDAGVKEGKNRVVLSSAAAQKYRLSEGDKIILTDAEEDRDYAFTVDGIAQYAAGLYVFMDIDSMRELFGVEEDYYNVVFSDEALDIPSGRLYAVTTRVQVEEAADIFVNLMIPMVTMMTVMSALIFGIVMYLMMKVMIDRSAFGISLIKIFGYRMKEIKKLYLSGNFFIVAVGAAICIPLAKLAMDAMYPVMIANTACGMNLAFPWQLYVEIYAAILLLYFVINCFLTVRLRHVLPAEVLKNRE